MPVDLQKVSAELASNPGAVIEDVAKAHGITPSQVIASLPTGMVSTIAGSKFQDVLKDVANWGDVTLIIHTEDGIMEFGGPIPAGEVARGYYNVPGSKGFHGHLRFERCRENRFRRTAVHGPGLGVHRVCEHRWRHHVQNFCRQRRKQGDES